MIIEGGSHYFWSAPDCVHYFWSAPELVHYLLSVPYLSRFILSAHRILLSDGVMITHYI